MKKMISGLLAVSCVLVITSNKAAAQDNGYVIPAAERNFSTTSSSNIPVGVNTTTHQNFTNQFKNASEVKWTSKAEQTLVYFKENGVATRGSYNSAGKLQHVIRYYYKEQTPEKYVNLMRRNGYTAPITLVSEVTVKNTTSAFVKMEDNNTVVTVQVYSGGEIGEVENFNRAR